jgi:hypothetical protein
MASPLTCLLCGWLVKQLEYVEESKQHMCLEPLALDQSWQHRLAATFRCMVEVLIEDGFYRTHLCEDCNCQACNILRWAHSPKCECDLKLNGTFNLEFVVRKKKEILCLFFQTSTCSLVVLLLQGKGTDG